MRRCRLQPSSRRSSSLPCQPAPASCGFCPSRGSSRCSCCHQSPASSSILSNAYNASRLDTHTQGPVKGDCCAALRCKRRRMRSAEITRGPRAQEGLPRNVRPRPTSSRRSAKAPRVNDIGPLSPPKGGRHPDAPARLPGALARRSAKVL